MDSYEIATILDIESRVWFMFWCRYVCARARVCVYSVIGMEIISSQQQNAFEALNL